MLFADAYSSEKNSQPQRRQIHFGSLNIPHYIDSSSLRRVSKVIGLLSCNGREWDSEEERTTITADHPLGPLSTRKLCLRGALDKEAVDLDNEETELKMHFTKPIQLMTPNCWAVIGKLDL